VDRFAINNAEGTGIFATMEILGELYPLDVALQPTSPLIASLTAAWIAPMYLLV